MKDNIKRLGISMLVPILFLILWQGLSKVLDNSILLPSLGSVGENFMKANENFIGLGSLPRNLFISLVRVLLGYTAGALLGLFFGVLMGYYETMHLLFDKFFNAFRSVPPLGWIPLILGWFGVKSLATLFNIEYGKTQVFFDNFKFSMIFIIGIGTFFPVLTNASHAIKSVDKTLIESAKVLGGNEKDIFTKILLPAAGPTIFTGLRTGLGSAWACLIAAEMLPGSLSGVGYLITHAYELARTDLVITGIVCIGLVGALLDYTFILIDRKKFSWQGK